MKVRYKINTLRGIFLCLKMNKGWLCPHTVFSQRQKIKNVCLKRRFQFVGRRLQIENPFPFAWKAFACFSATFSLSSALVLLRRNKDRPSLHYASKRLTLSFCSLCEFKSSSLCNPRSAGGTLQPAFA